MKLRKNQLLSNGFEGLRSSMTLFLKEKENSFMNLNDDNLIWSYNMTLHVMEVDMFFMLMSMENIYLDSKWATYGILEKLRTAVPHHQFKRPETESSSEILISFVPPILQQPLRVAFGIHSSSVVFLSSSAALLPSSQAPWLLFHGLWISLKPCSPSLKPRNHSLKSCSLSLKLHNLSLKPHRPFSSSAALLFSQAPQPFFEAL
ncbi:hypothetical protein QYF36_011349 [Acer negundo]|nr:hypothetical protein QYF36_011349 [Acer negundo]